MTIPRKTSVRRVSPKREAALIAELGYLPSRTVTAQRKPIKTRSKKRERNDPTRIYGPETFRNFLHRHACLGCGASFLYVEQAHIHCGGQGRKDDWQRTVPLCGEHTTVHYGLGQRFVAGCHHDYDNAKRSWAKANNLAALQAEFWRRWTLYCDREGLDPQTGRAAREGMAR